ncbi:MAG TPA: hypothetical protein VN181_11780, partial [Thermoanaerobaculia bacterium]|nr:hypothetical protein [Thermoanaerobaculia bacterium]
MRSRLLALAFFTALFASHAFAQPTATITHIGPPKHALLGTDVTFCLRFENTGNAVGYGPYIDLLLDDGGGSAVPLCDGLSYVSAALVHTNPSLPLNAIATPQIAPPCGTATTFTHPWGNPPPSSTTGKEFVRLELPFGSFQNGQEPLDIEVTAHIDAQADVGTALTFEARGDYRWTPLPLSPWVTQTVTPEVVMIEKKFLGAENESVPGPNFPGKYEITIDVAGQIANATLKDCATPGVVFSSTGTNCFTQNWTSLSGHNVLTPSFTITQPPAIPMPSCRITLNNRAELVAGTWTPAPPDPPINFANVPYPFGQVTIDQKAMAIQKSVTGNPVPGGSLAYRLDFQVSDYHRFRDIVVTDVLSDGQ